MLVVARELIVGGAMVVLTLMGMERFDVAWVGKAGTFCLLIAFPLFLLGGAGDGFGNHFARFAAWCWGIPGLLFSLLRRRHLRPGHAAARWRGPDGHGP